MNSVNFTPYAWAVCDIGLKRARNEDKHLISSDLNLYAVADGMGGHLGGEQAANLAIKTIEKYMRARKRTALKVRKNKINEEPIEQILINMFEIANRNVFSESEQSKDFKGMGTTLTTLFIENSMAYVGHVGDSRAYLFRGGVLKQITEDHSLVNQQVKAGIITQVQARKSYLRNIVTRSIGHAQTVCMDFFALKIKANDIFLLCTDGVNSMLSNQDIERVLTRSLPQTAARKLVDLANYRGGDDNATAVVISMGA